MSKDNIALVKGLYEAFGRGEIGKIVSAVTPDISWEIVGRRSDFPTFGQFRGTAGAFRNSSAPSARISISRNSRRRSFTAPTTKSLCSAAMR